MYELRNGRSISHETRPDRSKRRWLVRKTPYMECWGVMRKAKLGGDEYLGLGERGTVATSGQWTGVRH